MNETSAAADALIPVAIGEDYAEIRDGVRKVCAEFPAEYWREADEKSEYPHAFVDTMTRAGFLGALIPEEYGGSGLPLRAASVILEEIHYSGCSAAACHAQMYIMGTVLRHGSEAQKRQYLPGIASGELRLQAFGVSEPTSGTDTTQLRTRAASQLGSDWVWPYWLRRQTDPASAAFVPRGHLPFLANVTSRNWTMIGNLGSAREAVVDPRGLVSPWHDSWSLDWWVRSDERWHHPSREAGVRQDRPGESLADRRVDLDRSGPQGEDGRHGSSPFPQSFFPLLASTSASAPTIRVCFPSLKHLHPLHGDCGASHQLLCSLRTKINSYSRFPKTRSSVPNP